MKKFVELTTKKDRVAHIKEMLKINDKWALRGLIRIYEYQTEDEKNTQSTRYHNKVGFNGPDAEILTSYAQQYLRKGSLSVLQIRILHDLMPKYAGQLERLSTPKTS